MITERLKKLRKEAGFTQKQVATQLNVSQPAYANWEKGIKKPTPDKLKPIAIFFNVSIDYLLGKSDIKNPNQKSEIETLFEQLDDGQKEEAITIIKNLIKEK